MINQSYFSDIQKFPAQFSHKYGVNLNLNKKYNRIIVCGMGGSAFYVAPINDLLVATGIDCRLDVVSTYQIPPCDKDTTLIVCSSYSGSTEETLECFDTLYPLGYDIVVFSSRGKLMLLAQEHNLPFYQIPA